MLTTRRGKSNIRAIVITVVCFAVFAVFLFTMLNNAVAVSGEEALRIARDSVVRAVVSCYAYEGFYPGSIEYLVEHYNLLIDTDRFSVFYDKLADNLMPNIIVTERGG
jgi:FlaG/FlaF family flagellin (archaellin)